MQYQYSIRLLLVGLLVSLITIASWAVNDETQSDQPQLMPEEQSYPYGSENFTKFVDDSCDAPTFYSWMEKAYEKSGMRLPGKEHHTLAEALAAQREEMASIEDIRQRSKDETRLAIWLYKLIKKTIPRFSVVRGYEFKNVIRYGERQCFLQASLIASMLQEMGVQAGVVMVYQKPEGKFSNNGHTIVIVKLSSGRHILVDASKPTPLVRDQGLLVRSPDYIYVRPIYSEKTFEITSYKTTTGGRLLEPLEVQTMDIDFMLSQFMYYRGERTPGGLMEGKPTKQGLEMTARYLEKSVNYCPSNQLAVYQLGRAYRLQGRLQKALECFQQAHSLYAQCGWIPEGPKQFLKLTQEAVDKRVQR